jgi:cob(I)alamin adenosyltransferase
VPQVSADDIRMIEQAIDRLDERLEPLRRFIMPGGTQLAATLHLARTVCRRAERACVALAAAEPLRAEVLVYLNRLSDYLFVAARTANAVAGRAETTWRGLRE